MLREYLEHQYSDARFGHQPVAPPDDVLSSLAANYRRLCFYRDGDGQASQIAESAIAGAVKWLLLLLPQARQTLAVIEADLLINYSHAHRCNCGEFYNCLGGCEAKTQCLWCEPPEESIQLTMREEINNDNRRF
jgi:hypothetical protein